MRSVRSLALAFILLALPARAAEVQEVTTPSGLTAWLIEEHSQPLLSLRLAFKDAGSAHDPAGKEGRARLAAGLLSEGAGPHDALSFNNALENRAIALGFGADEDLMNASFKTLSEHKEEAASLLGEALCRPRFDEGAIGRVRMQALTALKQLREDPDYLARRAWMEAAFPAHPYGRPEEGTEKSLRALSRRDFTGYVSRYLTRGNVLIAAVGDITPAELSALLEKNLACLPVSFRPDMPVEAAALPARGEVKIVEKDIPQTVVMFGLPGIAREDPGYYDAYVLNYIVGGGGALNSRLGREIRLKNGLAYGVGSQLVPLLHAPLWTGYFSTRNEKAGEALALMRETLRAIAEKGVTDGELEDAKRYITGSFVMSIDTNSELAAFLLSMQLHHLGRDYLDKRNGFINAVTAEPVNAMARRLLKPDALLVAMAGKAAGKEKHGTDAR